MASKYKLLKRKIGDGYTYFEPHSAAYDFSVDVLVSGTESADTEDGAHTADKAIDGNTATYWASTDSAFPHWWKYDLGAAVTKTVCKLRLKVPYSSGAFLKDFKLQGSNNDSDWTDILDTEFPDDSTEAWHDFHFTNATAYRYYRIIAATANWVAGNNSIQIYEIEMMEKSTTETREWTWKEMLDLTTNTLGGTSADAELVCESEIILDEIQQEQFPVQIFTVGGKGTFKLTLNAGDADILAIALGLAAVTAEEDVLASGDDADTLLIGLRKPVGLSLLHKVANSQVSGYIDYFYMPNVQVDPSFTLTLSKKTVRTVEVTFHLLASVQTAMAVSYPPNMGGIVKILHQSST